MSRIAVQIMSLDVGDKRIGVAFGESGIRIAVPYRTIDNDEKTMTTLAQFINKNDIDILVVGRPIDQEGRATEQTAKTEEFMKKMMEALLADKSNREIELASWGESGTSMIAEDVLKKTGRSYSKGDIDMQAAAVILQDFMESNEFGRLVKKVAERKAAA
ncbi:Holliday junction resolvase RuvX [Candidatus Saccharibacteria bacterium]|nr:Holliday junction resolvase RuvX [Candidatus Saccharibacteria bacterium]